MTGKRDTIPSTPALAPSRAHQGSANDMAITERDHFKTDQAVDSHYWPRKLEEGSKTHHYIKVLRSRPKSAASLQA